MAGGSLPDVAVDDFMNWVKGFVDLLVLASGYQSSGKHAIWDADNIKKAMHWGIFFENVLKHRKASDGYFDFAKGLDAAMLELKKNPYFPPGLQSLSTSTLSKASDFVLWHFLQGIRLRDDHLTALITTAVEMDLDGLSKIEADCLNAYTEKLAIHLKSLDLTHGVGSSDFSSNSFIVSNSPSIALAPQTERKYEQDHSIFVIQELLKRQAALSRLSSVETTIQELSDVIKKGSLVGPDSIHSAGDHSPSDSFMPRSKIKGCDIWNQWRSNALLYFVNKRTVRLVSSANLIFAAPPEQWTQVYDRLRVPAEPTKDIEILELFLLGLISSRWQNVVEQVTSLVGEYPPVIEQYSELHKFHQGRVEYLQLEEHSVNSKESKIVNYLLKILATQPETLWCLPPVLTAAAIPSWSSLFSLYMTQTMKQIRTDSAISSCCTCKQNGKDHECCELAERIWCLYSFHVRLPSNIDEAQKIG